MTDGQVFAAVLAGIIAWVSIVALLGRGLGLDDDEWVGFVVSITVVVAIAALIGAGALGYW